MEIAIGCLAILIVIAVSTLVSGCVIFFCANNLICPAFGWHQVSWLQAFAIAITLSIIGGYFKNQGNSNGK